MTSELKRCYKDTDAAMLTAMFSIVQAAKDYQEELAVHQPSWTESFFTYLLNEIDLVIRTYMCIDTASKLRLSAQLVEHIHTAAIKNLEAVKKQVEKNFGEDEITRDELLDKLGYNDFFKQACDKDQRALVRLLYRFKQALIPEMQEQLTANGIDPGKLITIIGYAGKLQTARVSLRAFDGDFKSSTEAAIKAFNEIYNRVMDLAVNVAKFLKDDPAKQEYFNYFEDAAEPS